MTKIVAIVLLINVTLYQAVFGVEKCYQCYPKDPKNCTSPKIQTCGQFENNVKNYLCQSYATTIDGRDQFIKGCVENTDGNLQRCQNLDHCYTCNSDLCNDRNSGHGPAASYVLLVAILGTAYFNFVTL